MALPGARPAGARGAQGRRRAGGGRASSTARRRSSPPPRSRRGDEIADEEDFAAAACASFIVLLGAHARGLDGYWRTPEVLRTPEGRAACGIEDGERVLGLLHLGRGKGSKPAPERAPLEDFRTFLD